MGKVFPAVLAAALWPLLAAEGEGTPRLVKSARGVVNVLRANIRSGPSKTYNIIITVDEGTELTVRSFRDGWFEVDLPKGSAAWIYSRWVKVQAPEPGVQPAGPVVGVVSGRRVRVRAAPDMQSTILAEKKRNETVRILGQSGDWYKVEPPEGATGWIWSELVDLEEGVRVAGMQLPADTAEAVVGEMPPLPGADTPPLPGEEAASAVPALREPSLYERAERLFAREFERPALERDFREVVALYNRVLEDPTAGEAVREKARARLGQIFRMLPRRKLLDYMLELSRKVEGELREIERRYRPTIEALRSRLPEPRYTARGVLYEAEPGEHRYPYRLKLGDVTLYLIRTDRTDLDYLVGRKVGVIGRVEPAPPGAGAEVLELAGIEPLD